jgi:hypothetical protein
MIILYSVQAGPPAGSPTGTGRKLAKADGAVTSAPEPTKRRAIGEVFPLPPAKHDGIGLGGVHASDSNETPRAWAWS